MEDTTETAQPRTRKVALKNLFLDPNNYRFIDQPDYRRIDNQQLTTSLVQRRSTIFLLGKRQENVKDLIASFRQNGWLEIDRVLVRPLDTRGRYLVVEGNRRVATLKHLQRKFEEDAIDLGALDVSIFQRVPVTLYTNSDRAQQLMMMGLNHIASKKRWPPVNQATMLRRLLEEVGDPEVVCNSLGLKRRALNLSLRTLTLCELYKESDYGDQFTAEMFSLFTEVMKLPSLRDWLGLDLSRKDPNHIHCTNPHRLERLFSWLSEEPESEDETFQGKALSTFQNIRDLGKIISDPTAVERLEETRSLSEASLSSDSLLTSEVERNLKRSEDTVIRLDYQATLLTPAQLKRLDTLTDRLHGILKRGGRLSHAPSAQAWEPINAVTRTRFTTVTLSRYRRLRALQLSDLRPINLIIGTNNAGKTSTLEAIYLLSRLNDDRALIQTIERRARVQPGQLPARWLADQLPERVEITGTFDDLENNQAQLQIYTEDRADDLDGDQSAYLLSLISDATYAGQRQRTHTVLQENRPRRTRYEGDHWLCRSVFSSPFVADAVHTLQRHNKESFDHKSKTEVLSFIREHLDPGVEEIELTEAFEHFCAFGVTHQRFDEAQSLSSFGQGLRRVFEIGLAFATARHGVLLIDEIENGLHVSLLPKMVSLIEQLAHRFKVQVFASTHSKDTIDAFATHSTPGVVANYVLRDTEGTITTLRMTGEELAQLQEWNNIDLRGLK